ncbi:hypothetical protein HMPREF9628_01249 [Peptoanaerobacter stomatis]|uniref:Phosphomevalonate dehydratase small subunit-like domain-containing protein n=1 Tax=Peptoanaerobacter stomatis TaxID=796937 RepID=G9XB82_9FIRM|nr:DUF126 domain-containing protein [Peptoanaerobacter stomatis]EHL19733.1 hypothetical protein HMPREF9628_01249 [Peptoanaerobacter stomatis]
MKKVFKCHKISEGVAEAEVTISKDDIMFYLIDPKTGIVLEQAHDMNGRTVSNKVLIFPSGKGSSVVQADGLFQLMKEKNQPAAMIVKRPETVLVTSAILFGIPMVDKVEEEFFNVIKEGDLIRIDADKEEITIL